MNLESVIQSEVSQKEKNKYEQRYTESRKMVLMNLLAGQEQRRRRRERAVDTGCTSHQDDIIFKPSKPTALSMRITIISSFQGP